jgi:hypothetical protein
VSAFPRTTGAEIEALAGSNPSFAAWEQNELLSGDIIN